MNLRACRDRGGISGVLISFVAINLGAACAPSDRDGRISVRTLEVAATDALGSTTAGGALDSTWTIPGREASELTRSLVFEPGDDSESPNRLVNMAFAALVTGFDFDPPGSLAEDISIAEDNTSGLLEITVQPGIVFRAAVITDYQRDEEMVWHGAAEFGDILRWVDGTQSPADTLRLDMRGEYQDIRYRNGEQEATLRAQGTLYIASAGEYTVEVTEHVRVTSVEAARVSRRLADAREAVVR